MSNEWLQLPTEFCFRLDRTYVLTYVCIVVFRQISCTETVVPANADSLFTGFLILYMDGHAKNNAEKSIVNAFFRIQTPDLF